MGMFSPTRGAFSPHREAREWEDERERLRRLDSRAVPDNCDLPNFPSVCKTLGADPEVLIKAVQSLARKHGSVEAVPERQIASTLRQIVPDIGHMTPDYIFVIAEEAAIRDELRALELYKLRESDIAICKASGEEVQENAEKRICWHCRRRHL